MYILVPRAYDPSGLRQESTALGATISGMRHRCRLRETRWAEFGYFLLLFQNGLFIREKSFENDETKPELLRLHWMDCHESVRKRQELDFDLESKLPDDDLCRLPTLSEQTLLEHLEGRFSQGRIYTYVGEILIAVNPFRFFPMYNPKFINAYNNRNLGSLPPHIFAIADVAFHRMLREKKSQCVVISGESGSGKTESTKLLVHHLTALGLKTQASSVEKTILGVGPVLEVFTVYIVIPAAI